jgi:glycosyltransferase involved in cell wall biosynthesis
MKVLASPAHIFLNPAYGSEVSWACNIMMSLAKDYGVQIDAICGEATDLHLPQNIRLFKVGFSKGDLLNRGLFTLRNYNLARRLVRGVGLVHHMFPFGFRMGFNLLAVFGHLREKPFIIGPIQYPQEYLDITDYEWLSGKRGTKARLSYSLENAIAKLISRPIKIFHEVTLREAEALVFDSKKALRLYGSLYPDLLRGKVLEVIPPGVETETFKYVPPVKKGYFEIMTAGYLLRRKGVQYLIETMPLILEEFKNIKLRIVGDGPFKHELVRLVKRLSLDGKVSFEGLVPRSALVSYYANCDIYVQPSLSETFPSTIREVMSVGRPVIATKVGFVEEHIIDGVNGFLAPKGDSEEMVNKILLLISDEDLRLKISAKAREYAESNFDWERIIAMWYSVYQKVGT